MKMQRKFVALVMALLMLCATATTAFAEAPADDVTATASACMVDIAEPASTNQTVYVQSSGDGDVGTEPISCNVNMGWGTYTMYYFVSKPCTLYLWTDAYTIKYEIPLSATGQTVTTSIKVDWLNTIRYWNIETNDQSGWFSYALRIVK